jgi:hypothetical protein
LHAIIGIALYWQYLDTFELARSLAPRESLPVLVQYEYHVRSPDERVPQEAHERPVETETPEDRPIELARTVKPEPRIDEPTPEPLPETQPSVEPTQMQMRRNEFAAAKRADLESLVSRSTTQVPAQPSEQISAPEQAPAIQPSAQIIEAREAAIARTQNESSPRATPAESAATIEISRSVVQPSRRIAEAAEQSAPSSAAQPVTRALAAPAELAQAADAVPANIARPEAQPPEIETNPSSARSEMTTPIVRRDNTEIAPTPEPSAVVAQTSAAPAVNTTRPVLPTPATEPTTSRGVAQAAPSQTQPIDRPAIAAQEALTPSVEPSAPASTLFARSAASIPQPSESTPGDLPSSPAASVPQTSNARREQNIAPSVNSAARADSALARATRSAANAASTPSLDSPDMSAANASTNTPSQQPAATSLARSMAGVLGVGRSENFDRGLPAAPSNARVASAASQRAASTMQSGPSVAASAPSAIRRSRADAAIDSATALAQDSAPADYRAGAVASEIEATSGAAVSRAESAAPIGNIAADAGQLPADTGASQIVSTAGLARSDGGGQPTVASTANAGTPSRTSVGDPATAPASGNVAAPSLAAPAPSGSPTQTSLAAQSTGAARGATSAQGTGAPANLGAEVPAGAQRALAASANAPAQSQEGAPAPAPSTSASPSRTNAGDVAVDPSAAAIQVAGPAPSQPTNAPSRLNASASNDRRETSGLSGRTSLAEAGAAASDLVAEAPTSAATGAVSGNRAQSEYATAGPAVSDASAGAPLARSTTAAVPASAGNAVDVSEFTSNAPAAVTVASGDAQPGPSTGPGAVERRSSGGVPVQVAAVAGPGGLGAELAPVVGSRSPQAQRESELIHDTDTRFLGREISGALPAETFVRDAAKAFERRGREDGAGQGQPGAKTEEAIERGLEFLARCQQEDGSWSFQRFPGATADDAGAIHSDTAATGLALMAFLGGGYDHFEDKHRDTVRRGLEFLRKQQKQDGDLYAAQDAESHKSAWLYSHGIASIALCEAFGMTGDAELRGPAQRAIDFIEAAQDRQYGGWRYQPGVRSDTSVAGWMLMALKSGDLAGLKVKTETYDAVRSWLDRAQVSPSDGSQYVYNPTEPNNQIPADRRRPTMTSVGLLMRLYMGWDRARPEMKRGAEHILRYPAAFGTSSNPLRDTYYWYYATQVMFHMRGDYWKKWNGTLYPLLISTQNKEGTLAGSWSPGGAVSDRWGSQGGRIYVTTLNLLSLEVYYRHLPIYEETGK